MWNNILVAYDGSEYANHALSQALELANTTKASLIVLSVVRLPEPMFGLEPETFIDEAGKYYQEHFDKAIQQLSPAQQQLELEVVVGRPADTILNFARQQKVDLLVIGFTKKKPLLDKIVLGSVAKQVLDNAEFSVLLVR